MDGFYVAYVTAQAGTGLILWVIRGSTMVGVDTRSIFEVDSFNEIFRKHISHARGEIYESDVAISCWGHVYRFMDMLSERMSEDQRMPNVWNSPKKANS
jgi:hypothetical protein